MNEAKNEWVSMYQTYTEQQKNPYSIFGQSIQGETLAHGNPFHFSSLEDPYGSYLGYTKCGGNVLFDEFTKTKTRLYYNSLVIGGMGSGKSTFLKKRFKDRAARGDFVRVFDITGEFSRLTKYYGGKIIKFGSSNTMLNPFEILRAGDNETINFQLHMSKLSANYKYLVPTATEQEVIMFSNIARDLYQEFNLYSDVDGKENQITGLLPEKYPTYTDVFSKKLCQLGETHPELVAVTAAMPDGTGVAAFGKRFPDRFFDVGIAEAHAVTSAAGMAAAGLRPVVAVYSSFLQRGYDQILHDVCIQNLPVIFAVDRAGLVGSDGETHQGIFDYSYLTSIPNMSVAAPKNLWELRAMLDFAMDYKAPFAIRYPRGTAYRGLKEFMQPISYGKGEMLYEEEDIALLAVGSMVSTGEHVREKLKEEGYSCTLANARFVKPFDKELVERLAKNHRLIVTMEENVLQGGFGLPVTAYIHEHYPQVKVLNIALPDAYVEHGNVSVLREGLGIDSDSIIRKLKTEGWL